MLLKRLLIGVAASMTLLAGSTTAHAQYPSRCYCECAQMCEFDPNNPESQYWCFMYCAQVCGDPWISLCE